MRKALTTFVGGLLAVVIVVAGWFFGYAWDRETLRYRLTFEIATPQGTVEASGVVQTSREDTTRLPLPNTGYGYDVKGEAVVADLGNGNYLFALLKEGPSGKGAAHALPFQAFLDGQDSRANADETPVEFFRRLNRTRPSIRLSADQLPLLVRFEDLNDPTTVQRVDPNNLAATFGQGVSLTGVRLAITADAITEGVVKPVLMWLRTIGDGMLDGKKISTLSAQNRLANDLSRLDFERE